LDFINPGTRYVKKSQENPYVKAGVQAGGSGRPGNPPPGLSRPWQQLNLLHKLNATAESGGVTVAALSASMMVPPKTVVSAPKVSHLHYIRLKVHLGLVNLCLNDSQDHCY